VSFTLVVPLAGAAIASRPLSISRIAGLTAIAIAFHLFAYVSNDVVDLPLDRTEPQRSDSPLVLGLIRPSVALAIALAQVPVAFAIHAALGGPSAASLALLTALALMLVYNIYGKRLAFPPLGDAVQGVSWSALALYGVLAAGALLNASAAALASLIFVCILLINGVHGGVRDVENDHRRGARTTAIYLGARADGSGSVILPRSLVAYGLSLQALMLVISLAAVVRNWAGYGSLGARTTAAAIVAGHVLMLALLRTMLRPGTRRSDLIRAGILHIFVSLASLIVPFAWLMDRVAAATVISVYALPALILVVHDGLTWE
jgi:4-hydroxybenzoate polyprenyltransferase